MLNSVPPLMTPMAQVPQVAKALMIKAFIGEVMDGPRVPAASILAPPSAAQRDAHAFFGPGSTA
jgi:hypothetical protein